MKNNTEYDTGHCWFYLLSKEYPTLEDIKKEAKQSLPRIKKDKQWMEFYDSCYFKKKAGSLTPNLTDLITREEKAYLDTLKNVDKTKKKWIKKGAEFKYKNHLKDELHEQAFDDTIEWCTGASLTHNHLFHHYVARLLQEEKVGTRKIGGRLMTCS